MKVSFRVVRRQTARRLDCKTCGKSLTRTFTGSATYNPFNHGDPPAQAREDAERQAEKAEREGVTCKSCADAPQREALVAFANGTPLPERKWGNPTDILLDRENIRENYEQGTCPCCKQHTWTLTGYEITDKGRRVIAKIDAALSEALGHD